MKRLVILLLLVTSVAAWSVERRSVRVPVDPDGIQRATLVGGEYWFDPYHLVVKAGVPVELYFRKDSRWIPHTLVIDAPEAGIAVRETMEKDLRKVVFTPKKPGRYAIVCDKKLLFFESHRDKGMEGVLEVVE